MKTIVIKSLFLGLATAALVPRQANYDGYQVVRLQVGDNLARVQSLIRDLSLSTWNGGPKPNSEVDVVVPAGVVQQFDAQTAGLSSSLMHPNLGESIAREADYPVYQGMSASCTLLMIKEADQICF